MVAAFAGCSTSLLLLLGAACALYAGNVRSEDCAGLLGRASRAEQSRDVAALKAIAGEVRDVCRSAEREQQVRQAVAGVILADLESKDPRADQHADRYLDVFREALSYDGNSWLANALLGDAYDARSEFAKATEYYQRAIDALRARPTSSTGDQRVIEQIFRKAEITRLAAAAGPNGTYVKATTGRSGEPSGLSAPVTRMISVRRQGSSGQSQASQPLPSLPAQCKSSLASSAAGRTRGAVMHAVATPVYFEFDSTNFSKIGLEAAQDMKTMVDARLATAKAEGAPVVIRLVGHTDHKGSDEYNDDLSLRRAQALREWLKSNLSGAVDIDVAGCGKRIPLELDNRGRYSQERLDGMDRRVQVEFLDQ